MERRKFYIGLAVLLGLFFGSFFTNGVYQDYLRYGGKLDSMMLRRKDFGVSGSTLFPYILFKRVKQYGIIFLMAYILRPAVLAVTGVFGLSFFLGSILSIQVIQMGAGGLAAVVFSLFPHFIFYGLALYLLYARNEKEEMPFTSGSLFLERFSVQIEILLIITGCFFESFLNPKMMEWVLHFF